MPWRVDEHAHLVAIVWLFIATASNIAGGVALVTLFRIAQVRQER